MIHTRASFNIQSGGGNCPLVYRFAPPTRACFAPEKVPFFQKAIIFLLGDTKQRNVLQHNATRFSKNWPF